MGRDGMSESRKWWLVCGPKKGLTAMTKIRTPVVHYEAIFGTAQLTPDGPSEAQVSFLVGDDEHFFCLSRSELERLKVKVDRELRGKE